MYSGNAVTGGGVDGGGIMWMTDAASVEVPCLPVLLQPPQPFCQQPDTYGILNTLHLLLRGRSLAPAFDDTAGGGGGAWAPSPPSFADVCHGDAAVAGVWEQLFRALLNEPDAEPSSVAELASGGRQAGGVVRLRRCRHALEACLAADAARARDVKTQFCRQNILMYEDTSE
jgi:hypothetical protein